MQMMAGILLNFKTTMLGVAGASNPLFMSGRQEMDDDCLGPSTNLTGNHPVPLEGLVD